MGNVPVKYKGEVVAFSDENGKLIIKNHELWNKIVSSNSKSIFISSRAKGTIIPDTNTVVREEPFEYDIQSLTAEDVQANEKDSRSWNRFFEKDSLVMLDEEWMSDKEKELYKNLLGKTGIVLECSSDLHAFGRGSLCQHTIKWPGGIITGIHDGTYDKIDFTPNGFGPPVSILELFQVKFLSDLKKAFPENKIEFGRGERIFIDNKILPGVLCSAPRQPYNIHLNNTIDLINYLNSIKNK